jgi:Mg2+ and Co2+ transporter CorA
MTLDKSDKFFIERSGGRTKPLYCFYRDGDDEKDVFEEAQKLENSEPNNSNGRLSLWSLYLDQRPEKYQYYGKLHDEAQKVLNNLDVRRKTLDQFHTNLLSVLNDSASILRFAFKF